jgi:hypothetical protein
LECSNGIIVLAVRCGGELESTAGHSYAHQQNGKSECYIRTIEEGGHLLADAGLPMSFWLDAVLTCQYLIQVNTSLV